MGLADDLRDLLVTGNLSATVHVGELQEAPDRAVVIVATPGLPTLRTCGAAVLETGRVQLRTRATDYPTAEALMTSAHGKLDGQADRTLGGRTYYWIEGLQPPFYLGLDDAKRPMFACNYSVLRAAST